MLGRFNGFLKARDSARQRSARPGRRQSLPVLRSHESLHRRPARRAACRREEPARAQHVLNCCGVIITTNHKADGIYLPADDRRHFVAWSELTKEDFTPRILERRCGAGTTRAAIAMSPPISPGSISRPSIRRRRRPRRPHSGPSSTPTARPRTPSSPTHSTSWETPTPRLLIRITNEGAGNFEEWVKDP